MCIHRLFKRQSPMASGARGVAFLFCILLIVGCGGEEAADSNPLVETVGEATFNTATPNYFPMTISNRWVYHNPDGSEWTREVTSADFLDAHRVEYAFSHNPALEEGGLDFFKAPLYIATPDWIVRPIKTGEIMNTKRTIDIHYDIRIQKEKNNGGFIKRFGILGQRTYIIHGFERSDFTLLKPPLVPGKTWQVFRMTLRGRHNTHNVGTKFTHVLEARSLISARINDGRQTVVTPAGRFENCLEILYYETPSVETTEFRSDLIPIEYGEERALLETKIHETAATEFMKLLPNIRLGSLWLAPGVGPVKIETPNGIAELIDYEVKAVASGQ